MPTTKLIAVFKRFPKEMFRVNNGRQVKLRAWIPRRQVYDISAMNGFVQPKATDPKCNEAPNGASMRPNSPYQQSLVSWRFRGDDVVVYAVPEGTALPTDLLLVHERSDHYSLQPAANIPALELDAKINRFLTAHARAFTREEWLEMYPKATESL
ncbi:uncharacterized protein F5Z01DRAFT_681295 [Emericellopsis atlantica]|uniref:Tse2 ADP-ribosyltransferase toxin domain-containing protein n=1 Tax=Emericellopsis atlantica TaxID=2614577 RepID=A0A9P7ZN38_9HYPO|nr:uncharacterized protein F5Z01DRAFT_681295 [Emericellopsis atlantica]KAG9254762.1 hypothetical protein F5Z01DRAFT_681295 [Emericellopsis atlantica]